MKYTYRFAHLEKKPDYNVGHIFKPNEIIGFMGNTGQSTGAHLHIDCARGEITSPFSLSDFEEKIKPEPRQLLYMIDEGLFGVPPVITTGYADPEYFKIYKKVHYGFDVVPFNRKISKENYKIRWNRSMNGKVVLIVDDEKGYGHCVYVITETHGG